MKTVTSTLGLKAAICGSAVVIAAAALAQPAQLPSPTATTAQLSTPPGDVPSSNPRGSLPAMSPYRCLAEFVGTATNPNTGAPVRVSVNTETGRPLCPPPPQVDGTPPRR